MDQKNALSAFKVGACCLLMTLALLPARGATVRDASDPEPNTNPAPPPITLSVADSPDVYEGGNLVTSFVVSLSHAPAKGKVVTVRYRTEGGTASNFRPETGEITFTSKNFSPRTIRVTALADGEPPGGRRNDFEDFYLRIFDATGAAIVRSRGRARIFEPADKPNDGHLDPAEVPADVLKTRDRLTDGQGAHDFEYRRIGINDYVIFYTTKKGERIRVRIDHSGKIVDAPAVQEHGAPPPVAAGHVEPKKVPPAVLKTFQRQTDGKGARDLEYRRVGTDDYLVFYTDKNNKRMQVRIDASGDLVSAPSPAASS